MGCYRLRLVASLSAFFSKPGSMLRFSSRRASLRGSRVLKRHGGETVEGRNVFLPGSGAEVSPTPEFGSRRVGPAGASVEVGQVVGLGPSSLDRRQDEHWGSSHRVRFWVRGYDEQAQSP